MKVLVTGVRGQLGFEVVNQLQQQQVVCCGIDVQEVDLTDDKAVKAYVLDYQPDIIVHCAAYTAVDKAEEETELCEKVNFGGTKSLVEAAKQLDAKFMYISTDYVFPGDGQRPYEVDDPTGPISQYGKTKWMGEQVVRQQLTKYFICRVSWTFGENGANFVKTMLRLAKTNPKISVVNDQIGSPTYCKDIAKLVCDMIMTDKYGTYHVTNEGFCSWYDFAVEIFQQAGIDVTVVPVDSSQFPTKAVRPKNSRMSKQALSDNGFERLPTWQDALGRFLKNII